MDLIIFEERGGNLGEPGGREDVTAKVCLLEAKEHGTPYSN